MSVCLLDGASWPAIGNIPGFSEEMRHLGDFYMKGIEGHTKDTDRAFKYYEAAAVHGCRDSSLRVGKHYLEGPEPDDGKALFFLTAAAKVRCSRVFQFDFISLSSRLLCYCCRAIFSTRYHDPPPVLNVSIRNA
jgi:TPR repeat protein